MFSRPSFHAESNGSTPEAVARLVRALTPPPPPPLRYKDINFSTTPEHSSPANPTIRLPVLDYPIRRSSYTHSGRDPGDFEFPIKSVHQNHLSEIILV